MAQLVAEHHNEPGVSHKNTYIRRQYQLPSAATVVIAVVAALLVPL
jgi:uncharacterized membrane protein YdbT with pleckstrin-like domain